MRQTRSSLTNAQWAKKRSAIIKAYTKNPASFDANSVAKRLNLEVNSVNATLSNYHQGRYKD